MSTIEIVSAKAVKWQDYRDLRLLALKEEPQAFGSVYKIELGQSDSKWQERLQSYQEGKQQWMVFARFGKELIGMVGAWQSPDDMQNMQANLMATFVVPNQRGRGIGTQMLTLLIDEIKRSNRVSVLKLEVNPEKESAVKLYVKAGFQKMGEKQMVLGDGENHLVYEMEMMLE